MWESVYIEFKNLFAHVESKYVFKNGTCTVIFGKNETDTGFENNGSGKSTLFEAIGISFTGESLRNFGKEEFINFDSEDCEITHELENKFLNSKLKIKREFFRNKTTKVTLWEDGVKNTQIVSTNEANKRIFELLGITKEDLLRYFIIDQDSNYSFFSANDVDKKEIMNRITSANMINPAIAELEKRYKENKAIYDVKNSELEKLNGKLETLEEQKLELLESDSSAEEIAALKKEKKEKDDELKLQQESFDKYTGLLSGMDAKIKQKKKKISDKTALTKQLKDLKKEIEESEKMVRTLNNELEEKITCPHCKKDFILNSEYDLSIPELKALKEDTEKLVASLKKQLPALKGKIEAIETLENDLEDLLTEKRGYERKVKSAKENGEYINKRISKIEEYITALLNKKKDNKALLNVQTKIEEVSAEIAIKKKEVDSSYDELEMIRFWQYNMGKSGFLTFLANKSIKIIEGITNSFLRKFKVDVSILINGFKVLKDGSVREKIEVFVKNDGKTVQKFLAKSGGERGRVQIAGILGIQHLINLSTEGKGLNLLLLDEVFPGVDPLGQENIIKILEKLGVTVLMITQTVSDNFNNENTLYVRKVDGVSVYTELPKLLK